MCWEVLEVMDPSVVGLRLVLQAGLWAGGTLENPRLLQAGRDPKTPPVPLGRDSQKMLRVTCAWNVPQPRRFVWSW